MPADKTNNYYRMDMPTYNKLLESSTTSNYRKIRSEEADRIVIVAKEIAKSLDIVDRVKCTAKKSPFVSLKNHKKNFINNPTCRLINPILTVDMVYSCIFCVHTYSRYDITLYKLCSYLQ